MTPLSKLLETYRTAAVTEREKGTYFEELILAYLRNEATYKDLYSKVWTWAEWAPNNGFTAKDDGIDLVAEVAGTGEIHAIQCKFYATDYKLQKKDIDSFFTASGRKPFAHRIIVSSTDHWSEHAENALVDQQPPVSKITLHDLEESQVDWAKYQSKAKVSLKPKKTLLPHQQSALKAVTVGLQGADRGKLIMACGTGKTFTSLKIAEAMAGKGKRVLFLVPSLSLLSQTLTEWTQESSIPLHSFAVCSDSDVGKKGGRKEDDAVQTFTHELRYPATTDAKALAKTVAARQDDEHMTVVFSTYHSIEVIHDAQHEHGLTDFDLIVCDEAHRTTGATFEGDDESAFVRVHDADYIRAAKRMYMTATPRIYADTAKAVAERDNVALYSMDNEAWYGKQLFLISFSEAVKRGLLVDYKVIVLAVEESHINRRLQSLLKDENNTLRVDDAAKIVGCWKALAKLGIHEDGNESPEPMKRAVAFCQVIESGKGGKTHKVSSKEIAGMFQAVVDAYQDADDIEEAARLTCQAEHVDGGMNAGEKEAKLDWLKAPTPPDTCRVLSNVRCLSEGVDVPALDAVLFLTPRNSQVDVVQSVGRVMRNSPGKKRGYVVLPVVIPAGVEPHDALNDNQTYKVVWQVLQALRSHDDRFDAMVNKLDLVGPDRTRMEVIAIADTVQRKTARLTDSSAKAGKAKGKYAIGEKAEVYGPAPDQAQLEFEVGEIERALYAKVVEKCGNRHHWEDWANDIAMITPGYAELHCLSAFSFQRGASTADELFARAAELGYTALAITDECSLAGIVRAHEAAKKHDIPLIVGGEFQIDGGPKIVLLCSDQPAYEALCLLITISRRRAKKGSYLTLASDLSEVPPGLLCLWPARSPEDERHVSWLQETFGDRLWIAIERHREAGEDSRVSWIEQLADRHGLPIVATGDVHMHVRARRPLQDVLTATRHHCTVAEAGWRLFQNAERHLRSRVALTKLYRPEWMAESVRIAQRCTFNLAQLRYTYPRELVPEGHTPTSWLRHLTEEGVPWRWPNGIPQKARDQIEHELALIAELKYESYFLTVHDIVRFARSRGILCQGRGSAANSAVCFALGVTEVDPARMNLLFERFLSRERNEPPDIDIDFEHERREEVIQYVFERYGRERAALTAVATQYRGRSAIRDVARALGLPPDQISMLSGTMNHWEGEPDDAHMREAGFDPTQPLLHRVIALTRELMQLPRHLSQHPGGFVISEHPLHTLVPVENASMDDRTVIQWDKDDLDSLGLMKVDVLALGMLTAVRKTLDLLRRTGRRDLALATIPAEDPATYTMIGRADTLGAFQIESRAQMAMLPRTQPKNFYELVIEVAIVRPGPIQGDMVHPYLRRKRGEEPIDYPPQLKHIFERTLGVPLFQEQVMQLAIDAAGFAPGEADELRRSMAAWKRRGGLEPHRDRLRAGMLARGYTSDYAEHLFEQIKGFGHYGFPESHAASFALITYASCWLKCHEPAAYAVSLINSQPMGFYTPDQILQDARRHGIRVLPVDVRYSDWDCTLEFPRSDTSGKPEIRMGLRMVSGFTEGVAGDIVQARRRRSFFDASDLTRRTGLDRKHQGLLADAGALKGLAGHRHRARWELSGVERSLPLFDGIPEMPEDRQPIPMPTLGEDMLADYALVGTTLGRHPLSLIRSQLRARRCRRSSELVNFPHGRNVRFAGLVTMRQRPETAKGVTFITLEDEDGMVNALAWQAVAERQRQVLLGSRLLAIDARLERIDGVQHLIINRMEDYTSMLAGLNPKSQDFH